jgi:hypothetical protein
MERFNNKTEHELLLLYRNITKTLAQLKNLKDKDFSEKDGSETYYNDNSNAWYVNFIFSILGQNSQHVLRKIRKIFVNNYTLYSNP